MKFNLDILVCPNCTGEDAEQGLIRNGQQLYCQSCSAHYPLEDGAPNLITDPGLRTRLEDIDYDKAHRIDEKRRQRVFEDWSEILDSLSIRSDKILEIGSGTGGLTWGLMHQGNFDEVHATDISSLFLNQIASNYGEGTKNEVFYYVCDANRLPFRGNSFDVVVGHSVLHHFLEFELTLKAIYRILRPGGYAIFYEPLIQGKMYVAFILELIRNLDQSLDLNILSEAERTRIFHMVRHITKSNVGTGQREGLEQKEDKYIFDASNLSAVASSIGYANFHTRNYKTLDPGYKSYLIHQWILMGLDVCKLERFESVFETFSNTLGCLPQSTISTPMGFLLFRK